MRSAFAAFLRGFTLPFGVTSGRRIFFDGENGAIIFYRADGTEAIRIGGPPPVSEGTIYFKTGLAVEQLAPQIGSFKASSGGAQTIGLGLQSGALEGGVDPHVVLQLRSASNDNTRRPGVEIDGSGGGIFIGIASGADDPIGEATLVAGTVVVANATIEATSLILLTRRVVGGTPGFLSYVRNPGVGFTITSTSATDTSTVGFLLLRRRG
jgi:hypothetical protein